MLAAGAIDALDKITTNPRGGRVTPEDEPFEDWLSRFREQAEALLNFVIAAGERMTPEQRADAVSRLEEDE